MLKFWDFYGRLLGEYVLSPVSFVCLALFERTVTWEDASPRSTDMGGVLWIRTLICSFIWWAQMLLSCGLGLTWGIILLGYLVVGLVIMLYVVISDFRIPRG